MRQLNGFSKLFAWLAIWSLLGHALLPSMAQARTVESWVELCTSAGVQQVSVGADGQLDTTPKQKPHVQHCPFCLSGSHFALLPSPTAVVSATASRAVFVPAVCTPRVKSCKVAAAPPRGPPLST